MGEGGDRKKRLPIYSRLISVWTGGVLEALPSKLRGQSLSYKFTQQGDNHWASISSLILRATLHQLYALCFSMYLIFSIINM